VSHDVPVSIIAADLAVMDPAADWGPTVAGEPKKADRAAGCRSYTNQQHLLSRLNVCWGGMR